MTFCSHDYHHANYNDYSKAIVTGSEKTDHFVVTQIVQYGPKALSRSQSRDFAISMP